MSEANNVIRFPVKPSRMPDAPQTLEEVDASVDLIKKTHIQDTLEIVVPMLFDNLVIAGFDPNEQSTDFLKDGAFIVESIRSLLCKLYDMDHPLQQVASHMFVVNDDVDPSIVIDENIKVLIVQKPPTQE